MCDSHKGATLEGSEKLFGSKYMLPNLMIKSYWKQTNTIAHVKLAGVSNIELLYKSALNSL